MNLPLVSILINNYNYGRYVSNAIDSALNQQYQNVEVIVVDDGSTDNSKEVLEQYKTSVTLHFKCNGGQASAFNKGVELSRGEILCFLDADDFFEKEKVKTIVNTFLAKEDLGYVFDKVLKSDSNLTPIDDAKRTNKIEYTDLRDAVRAGKLRGYEPFVIPATSGLSFRKALIKKVFPIPESESCSMCENYMKYIAVGTAKGAFIDSSLTKQRIHGDNLFTKTEKDKSMAARISILTGYWLGKNFPELIKFANTQIALGLSFLLQSLKIEKKYYELIKKHTLSIDLKSRFTLALRTIYYYFRVGK